MNTHKINNGGPEMLDAEENIKKKVCIEQPEVSDDIDDDVEESDSDFEEVPTNKGVVDRDFSPSSESDSEEDAETSDEESDEVEESECDADDVDKCGGDDDEDEEEDEEDDDEDYNDDDEDISDDCTESE